MSRERLREVKRDSLPLVVDLRKRNAIHFPKQRFWERGCKVALHATALAVETRLAKILIPLRDNLGASRLDDTHDVAERFGRNARIVVTQIRLPGFGDPNLGRPGSRRPLGNVDMDWLERVSLVRQKYTQYGPILKI